MKLVKYYAWERFFEDKVAEFRSQERRLMIWNCVIKVINVSCLEPWQVLCTAGSHSVSA